MPECRDLSSSMKACYFMLSPMLAPLFISESLLFYVDRFEQHEIVWLKLRYYQVRKFSVGRYSAIHFKVPALASSFLCLKLSLSRSLYYELMFEYTFEASKHGLKMKLMLFIVLAPYVGMFSMSKRMLPVVWSCIIPFLSSNMNPQWISAIFAYYYIG